ncbi:MAG: hypothetical protein ACPLRZ_11490 [Thermovenabulum sp.]|uniref:hypothetical protein n=1 Tax=Thermovenabulum sp. TaxID=3100335 RepID=UPI003C7E1629
MIKELLKKYGLKGINIGIVKEGDILVIEGGIARQIIRKRGSVIKGIYCTIIDEANVPYTTYYDVAETHENTDEERLKMEYISKALKEYFGETEGLLYENKHQEQDRMENKSKSSNESYVRARIIKILDAVEEENKTEIKATAEVKGKICEAIIKGKEAVEKTLLSLEEIYLKISKEKIRKENNKIVIETDEVRFSKNQETYKAEINRDGDNLKAIVNGVNGSEFKVVAIKNILENIKNKKDVMITGRIKDNILLVDELAEQ